MANRRREEWQIDEWDESLDQQAASHKASSAPVNAEQWNTGDDWDTPAPPKPPRKSNGKWIAVIGSVAAVLIIAVVVLGGNLFGGSQPPVAVTAVVTGSITAEPVPDTPEPTVVQTDAPATEPPTKVPTPVPTDPPTPTPTKVPTPTPTEAPRMDAWYGEDMRYYYHQLTEEGKACYRILYTGIASFEKEISLRGTSCSKDELERVMFAIRNDSPELFQIDGSYTSIGLNLYSGASAIQFNYRLDRDQYEARCNRIREVEKEIRASIPEMRNEYEVEKAVYSWLITHCEYLIAEDKSTAYADSVLWDGKAQCAGYSEALSLLLRMMGVRCIEVRSVPEQEHQWNMVNIQDAWYNCDVTWDDQKEVPAEGEMNRFCFLNVPDRLMSEHTPEKDNGFTVPTCDSIAANYAYREGIYIPSPDKYPDTAGRINAEIQRAWISGHRRFLVMMDKGFTKSMMESVCGQIHIPEGTFFYYVIEETHCLYIIAGSNVGIHFIDVGQGDAILIRCAGENLLIDAGPAEAGLIVNKYLKDTLGSESLNYVIATHEHDDHIGGMPSALSGLSVGQIWSPPAVPMTWWTDNVLPGMEQQTLRIEKPAPLTTFMVGGAVVTFINTTQSAANPNDLSLAVRVDFGDSSAILTADIETDAEMDMLAKQVPLKATLLKLAHHGGNTSSSEVFIKAVSPSIAVISVGKGNKHGHPHAEPLRCLEKYNVSVYRTDEYGTIICTGDGKDWSVEVKKTR